MKIEEIIRLQGLSWLRRKAIVLADVTLMIKHYRDDEGIERIDVDQILTASIAGTREERILDWTEREREDNTFGSIVGKSRRVSVDELDIPYLKEGWTSETFKHGLIQIHGKSNTSKSGTTWTANQVRRW